MSDDVKSAVLSEGESVRRGNVSEESLPPDHDGPAPEADVEKPSRTATISPSIEADAEDDPQAPNRKGEG